MALEIAARSERWCFGASLPSPLDRVRARLDAAVGNFPEGSFARLGSRSAKDSRQSWHHGLRVTDGLSALKMLGTDSRRIAFDLSLARRNSYTPHVFLRKWVEIPKWAEFRCFMESRKLIGISQYFLKSLGPSPEIRSFAPTIETAIRGFFDRFVGACHLDDVVFDVYCHPDPIHAATNSSLAVTLIELNPFGPSTDPCLFRWGVEGDFDGGFRYL